MVPPDGVARPASTSPSPGELVLPLPSAPYASALQRYELGVKNRDFSVALAAAEELVALEPTLVEPYHCRGVVWQLLGDETRASRDRATCAAIDPHYPETAAICGAEQQLRAAYLQDPVVPPGLTAGDCRDEGLRLVIERRAEEIRRRRALFARPSCDLPCPSACCYFEDDTFSYGVAFTPGEADAVVAHLRQRGLDPDHYVTTIAGHDDLAYPLSNGRTYSHDAASWRPRTRWYRDMSWLTSRSRACAFLGDEGCAIHEIGSPPGIATCRSFLCMTAFVFQLLRDVGIVGPGDMRGCAMEEVQDAALAALPLLASRVASPAVLAELEEMRRAVAAAAESDRAGDRALVAAELERYAAARQRQADAEEAVDRALRPLVETLIESTRP